MMGYQPRRLNQNGSSISTGTSVPLTLTTRTDVFVDFKSFTAHS
jgi:hypothetical protein